MGYISLLLIGLVIGLFCAAVLVQAARRTDRSVWLWGIAGLVFNVFALLAWKITVGPLLAQ